METASNITAAIAPGDRRGANHEMHRHWNIVNWKLAGNFPGPIDSHHFSR
ncbi:MAG TPA: hypothetical protein ACFCUC_09585 [Desulfobacterales bacterium]